jgi:hypothetical protein
MRLLELPGYRHVGLGAGAALHLLARQRDMNGLVVIARVPLDRGRRNQHLAPGQPAARVDHEVAHAPALVVEVQVLYRSDAAVAGHDGVAAQVLHDLVKHWGLLSISEPFLQGTCKGGPISCAGPS